MFGTEYVSTICVKLHWICLHVINTKYVLCMHLFQIPWHMIETHVPKYVDTHIYNKTVSEICVCTLNMLNRYNYTLNVIKHFDTHIRKHTLKICQKYVLRNKIYAWILNMFTLIGCFLHAAFVRFTYRICVWCFHFYFKNFGWWTETHF